MSLIKRLAQIVVVVAVSLVLAPSLTAQPDSIFEKHLTLKGFVSSTTDMVGWLDLSADSLIDSDDPNDDRHAYAQVLMGSLLDPSGRQHLDSWLRTLRDNGVERLYVVVDGQRLMMNDTGAFAVAELPADDAAQRKIFEACEALGINRLVIRGQLIVGPSWGGAIRLTRFSDKSLTDAITDSLKEAIEACNGHHGLAIAPGPQILPTIQGMISLSPDLDPNVQAGIGGFQRASFWEDSETGQLRLSAQLGNEASAAAFRDGVNKSVSELLQSDQPEELLVANGNQVGLADQAQPVLMDLFQQSQQQARRVQAMNNLKQVLLAIHTFHDAHKRLPPQAVTDDEGNRLLSWRVLILPFIGENELYKQFHLDEPWDSPHNKALIEKMPAVFASADSEIAATMPAGHTCVVAPLTVDSVMGRPGSPMNLVNISDGTSRTVAIVETLPSRAVVWTQPDDLVVDENEELANLLQPYGDQFIAGWMDGSVRSFEKSTPLKTFLAWLSVDRGEVE